MRQFGRARRSRGAIAGQRKPVIDILAHFLPVERLQVEPPRHALLQLTQLRPGEQRFQLRLPDQDDLKECPPLVIHVREQADLFENVRPQVLRLVDGDDGVRLNRAEGPEKCL